MSKFGSRKIISGICLLCLFLLAGCSQQEISDEYILGKNRISCDNITITVMTPFELITEGKQVELADKSVRNIAAEGHNKNIQMFVTAGVASSENTVSTLADKAKMILKDNPSISDLKIDESDVKIQSVNGKKLEFVFDERVKGKHTNLTVTEYIFEYEGVVWRVIYQYRSKDNKGKQLSELIAGKIYLGATF